MHPVGTCTNTHTHNLDIYRWPHRLYSQPHRTLTHRASGLMPPPLLAEQDRDALVSTRVYVYIHTYTHTYVQLGSLQQLCSGSLPSSHLSIPGSPGPWSPSSQLPCGGAQDPPGQLDKNYSTLPGSHPLPHSSLKEPSRLAVWSSCTPTAAPILACTPAPKPGAWAWVPAAGTQTPSHPQHVVMRVTRPGQSVEGTY